MRGRRPNHFLDLILTVLTLGLWLIVWEVPAPGHAGLWVGGGATHPLPECPRMSLDDQRGVSQWPTFVSSGVL